MKTTIDLKRYEVLYDSFDPGHNRKHLNEVRGFAVQLAKNYCSEKIEVVYVAATLHDIGLCVAREGHEIFGYEMIRKDKEIKEAYSDTEFNEILEAIKEHRASTGKPKSLVAKIVSDADKVSDGTKRAFKRAYDYGVVNYPNLNHIEQMQRAAGHLYEKFSPGGKGTRVYFEESSNKLENTYKLIFKAHLDNDLKLMESFLK